MELVQNLGLWKERERKNRKKQEKVNKKSKDKRKKEIPTKIKQKTKANVSLELEITKCSLLIVVTRPTKRASMAQGRYLGRPRSKNAPGTRRHSPKMGHLRHQAISIGLLKRDRAWKDRSLRLEDVGQSCRPAATTWKQSRQAVSTDPTQKEISSEYQLSTQAAGQKRRASYVSNTSSFLTSLGISREK